MIAARGWNTWDVRQVNAAVHLPSGVRVRFSPSNPETGQCADEFGWRQGVRRLGPHAADGSYAEIDLAWGEAVVRLEYAARGDLLACCATPLANAASLQLQVRVDGAWNRPVMIQAQSGALSASAGGQTWIVRGADAGVSPASGGLVFPLDRPRLIVVEPASARPVTRPEADLLLDRQRAACLASTLRSDGWLGDTAAAITRAIAWNTIWEPTRERFCTPVSRDWCKGPFFGSYVLFDWDTFFCAVMAQLEDPRLAEANALAILQEVSAAGFVPNFGCEFGPSEDRSQPPVGAYCVLKLHRTGALGGDRRAKPLLERAFPALLRWHEWWLPHRDGNRDGLLEWGSDAVPGYRDDWQCNTMQAAMYESGLDNSPMYDEAAYNPQTHTMELADVGLNALYALDAWALSEMAADLGLAGRRRELAEEYQQLAGRINDRLWSEEAGIYLNRHWDGRFSSHLSPTLFYPLIAGIAPPERAGRMVREHLLDERKFWGRFVMPSIARSDPGYAGNDYWRGRIWGPMNYLVAEGLRRYRFDDVAHEFARRSVDLLLGEWRSEGHVHENYNADTGDGDDMPNSDPMYTWGALLGYVGAQELADCEPWAGWRFGNTRGEPASITGVHAGDDVLDVECGPAGLRVARNGHLFLSADQPVIVRNLRGNLRRDDARLSCRVCLPPSGGAGAWLVVGSLPPGRAVRITIGGAGSSAVTDSLGQVTLRIDRDSDIEIAAV